MRKMLQLLDAWRKSKQDRASMKSLESEIAKEMTIFKKRHDIESHLAESVGMDNIPDDDAEPPSKGTVSDLARIIDDVYDDADREDRALLVDQILQDTFYDTESNFLVEHTDLDLEQCLFNNTPEGHCVIWDTGDTKLMDSNRDHFVEYYPLKRDIGMQFFKGGARISRASATSASSATTYGLHPRSAAASSTSRHSTCHLTASSPSTPTPSSLAKVSASSTSRATAWANFLTSGPIATTRHALRVYPRRSRAPPRWLPRDRDRQPAQWPSYLHKPLGRLCKEPGPPYRLHALRRADYF
jgi:hypothetical protein